MTPNLNPIKTQKNQSYDYIILIDNIKITTR